MPVPIHRHARPCICPSNHMPVPSQYTRPSKCRSIHSYNHLPIHPSIPPVHQHAHHRHAHTHTSTSSLPRHVNGSHPSLQPTIPTSTRSTIDAAIHPSMCTYTYFHLHLHLHPSSSFHASTRPARHVTHHSRTSGVVRIETADDAAAAEVGRRYSPGWMGRWVCT